MSCSGEGKVHPTGGDGSLIDMWFEGGDSYSWVNKFGEDMGEGSGFMRSLSINGEVTGMVRSHVYF